MDYILTKTIDRMPPGTIVNDIYSTEKIRTLVAAGYIAAPQNELNENAEGGKDEGNSGKTSSRRVRLQHSDS